MYGSLATRLLAKAWPPIEYASDLIWIFFALCEFAVSAHLDVVIVKIAQTHNAAH